MRPKLKAVLRPEWGMTDKVPRFTEMGACSHVSIFLCSPPQSHRPVHQFFCNVLGLVFDLSEGARACNLQAMRISMFKAPPAAGKGRYVRARNEACGSPLVCWHRETTDSGFKVKRFLRPEREVKEACFRTNSAGREAGREAEGAHFFGSSWSRWRF